MRARASVRSRFIAGRGACCCLQTQAPFTPGSSAAVAFADDVSLALESRSWRGRDLADTVNVVRDDPSSADDLAEAVAHRMRAAIQAVKREVRALPQREAEALLSAVLGEDRRFLGDKGVMRVVRGIKDPWWAARHPFQAMRELQEP